MNAFRILFASLVVASMAPGVAPAQERTDVSYADLTRRGLSEDDFPRWKELAPNVYAYEGLHSPVDGQIINTVSLIVVTDDGVLVADGQGDVEQSRAMVDTIKELTSEPVKYMVIASDHGDHTGGNAAFAKAYPDIEFLASPASIEALAGRDHPPIEAVSNERTLELGGTEIQILNLGRAHTGGDLMVYLPASRVLFMSEIYLRGVFPAMRSAYPSEWVETIEKAQAMDVSIYVPGHGFIDEPARMERDLEAFREALVAVIAEATRLHGAKVTCSPPVRGQSTPCAAADQANWGPYADWTLARSQGRTAIVKVYQELEGKLP